MTSDEHGISPNRYNPHAWIINDPDMATKLRRFRHHGMSVSDIERHAADKVIIETYPEIGYNYRMTDIQAAIGIVQLSKLSTIIKKKKADSRILQQGIRQYPMH